jgi:Flp pilus assembly pilin Flp
MRRPWFDQNRKGQALLEYVLLIALVATCLVAILGLTRKAANDAYARTSIQLDPVKRAGFGGSSGGSWHPGGGGGGSPAPADADSVGGGSTDPDGNPSDSDGPVSASSIGSP